MNEVSTRFHGKDFIEVREGGYYDSGQEQHALLHDEDGMPRNERIPLKPQEAPSDEVKQAADEAAKAAQEAAKAAAEASQNIMKGISSFGGGVLGGGGEIRGEILLTKGGVNKMSGKRTSRPRVENSINFLQPA